MAIRTLHITNAWHPASGGVRTWYLALLAAAELASRRLAVVVPGTHDSVEVRGAIHTDRLARVCDALRNIDMPVTRASGAPATLMPR